MLTSQRINRHGFTAVELVLVIVVLAIVVGVVMVQVDKRRREMLRAECWTNLHAVLGTVRGGYTGQHTPPTNWMVPLSDTPGQLSPQTSGAILTRLGESKQLAAFTCPAHPNAERAVQEARTNPSFVVRDDSYWYLGYALPNEAAGLAFVEAYRKAVAETGAPPVGDVIKVEPYALGDGAMVDELFRLSNIRLSGLRSLLRPDPVDRPSLDGVSPPVVVERPGLHRNGAHILDEYGQVEFLEYPGEFPMTEKFIKALESLDALKEKNDEAIEK